LYHVSIRRMLPSHGNRHQISIRILSSEGLLSTRHTSRNVGLIVTSLRRPGNRRRDEWRGVFFGGFFFRHDLSNIHSTNTAWKYCVRIERKGTANRGRRAWQVVIVAIVAHERIGGRLEEYRILKHHADEPLLSMSQRKNTRSWLHGFVWCRCVLVPLKNNETRRSTICVSTRECVRRGGFSLSRSSVLE